MVRKADKLVLFVYLVFICLFGVYPHLSDEKTEAQRFSITQPKLHKWKVAESDMKYFFFLYSMFKICFVKMSNKKEKLKTWIMHSRITSPLDGLMVC